MLRTNNANTGPKVVGSSPPFLQSFVFASSPSPTLHFNSIKAHPAQNDRPSYLRESADENRPRDRRSRCKLCTSGTIKEIFPEANFVRIQELHEIVQSLARKGAYIPIIDEDEANLTQVSTQAEQRKRSSPALTPLPRKTVRTFPPLSQLHNPKRNTPKLTQLVWLSKIRPR
jgi:hypothetical protein